MLTTTLTPLSLLRQSAIVPHPAWRQALSGLLECASTGPTTLALLGEPGTGKSWLLRHLDTLLRKHGRAVTFLRQGDLPWVLEPGHIVLIDEASRLSERALQVLSTQRSTIAILADLPTFADALAQLSTPIPVVKLAPLGRDQIGDFVSRWLQLGNDEPNVTPLPQDAIERLLFHSGGTPRLVTRLLNAALALESGTGAVTATTIDEVAMLRWSAQARPTPVVTAPAASPAPAPSRRSRRRSIAVAAVASAVAASVLTLRISHNPRPETKPAYPLEAASIPAPTPAMSLPITVASSIAPEPLASPTKVLVQRPLPAALPPADVVSVETQVVPQAPDSTVLPAALPKAASFDTPGLVVIARHGDTLRNLYVSLYRGIDPPPFEEVAAANPRALVPGTFVVFPPPTGGWPQR